MTESQEPSNNLPQMRFVPDSLNVALSDSITSSEEDSEDYDLLKKSLLADFAPKNTIESLFVSDIIELSFDIVRLRNIKNTLRLDVRDLAVETLYFKSAISDAPEGAGKAVRIQAKQIGKKWRTDIDERNNIENHLHRLGYDEQAILLEEYKQGRELEDMIEKRIANAQSRRIEAMRFFNHNRELVQRLKAETDKIISGSAKDVSDRRAKLK